MATKRFTGAQARRAEKHTLTVTAVALGGTVGLSLNGKVVSYTCTAADTTGTAASALAAAIRASDDAEFNQLTISVSAAVLTLTSSRNGRFITATGSGTLSTTSGGGATIAAALLQAGLSPSDYNDTVNWAGASLPANGDDVYFEDAPWPCLYNLSQAASLSLASLRVYPTFAGNGVGLAKFAAEGYPEYRGGRAAFAGCTLLDMALPAGAQKEAYRFDVGAVQCSLTVRGQGAGSIGSEAVDWVGTHANNAIEVYGSALAVAPYVGDTAVVTTLKAVSSAVRTGTGATVNSLTATDCALDLRASVTTLAVDGAGGNCVVREAATVGTLTVDDGSVFWNSSGGITTLKVGSGGRIDFGGSTDLIEVVNEVELNERGAILDPFGRVTWTGGIRLNRTSLDKVTLNLGTGRLIAVS